MQSILFGLKTPPHNSKVLHCHQVHPKMHFPHTQSDLLSALALWRAGEALEGTIGSVTPGESPDSLYLLLKSELNHTNFFFSMAQQCECHGIATLCSPLTAVSLSCRDLSWNFIQFIHPEAFVTLHSLTKL